MAEKPTAPTTPTTPTTPTDASPANKIELKDLFMLLKAIEVAGQHNAFNELEIQAFKPSFDNVHKFLQVYQETLASQETTDVKPDLTAPTQDPGSATTKVVAPKKEVKAKKTVKAKQTVKAKTKKKKGAK